MKIGDLVELKSGGPLMTVTQLHDPKKEYGPAPDHVMCEWFGLRDEPAWMFLGGSNRDEKRLVRQAFPEAALRRMSIP